MSAGKAPRFNWITAALIHTPRDSWMEALVWLLPKTALKVYLEAYRPIALGQQNMRMLMTPLMELFTAVLRRKGMSCDVQFGAMQGANPAAPIYLA